MEILVSFILYLNKPQRINVCEIDKIDSRVNSFNYDVY